MHPRLSLSLAVVATASYTSAQWSNDPLVNTPVCEASGDQAVPKIASSPDGKTWIGWFDNRSSSYAMYLQCLDEDGSSLFATDGLLVSANAQSTSLVDWELIAASNGDAVLVFTDTRAGSDLDVYAYRISQAGGFTWGANGVTLSNNNDFEPSPDCAELSDGSFAFVWNRLPSGSDGSVRIQRLDAAGAPQYPPEGLAITGAAGEDPGFCQVVSAPGTGFVVLWLRDIGTFSSPRHIRLQQFDFAGNALWNGGAPLTILDAGSVPIAHVPEFLPDGSGGAVVAWHRSLGSDFDSYVQHVDAAGSELYPHNGLSITNEANVLQLDPALAYLPESGDCIVAFSRRNTAQSQWGVSAQRISAGGTLAWGNAGVVLEPLDGLNEVGPRIVPYGDGAVVLYFQEPSFVQNYAYAQRLDGNGAPVWLPARVTVSSQPSTKDDLEVVRGSNGDVRSTWHDERADSGNIYAQNLRADGALGNGTSCRWSSYCSTSANSVGPGALITAEGSLSIGLNDLVLHASGCPAHQSCLFFYSATPTGGTPFYDGLLCLSPPLFRLRPLTTSDSSGVATYAVDLSHLPPNGDILPGSTWYFQAWYRDPAAGGSGANLSDGLQGNFCP